jgi:5,5'-dehydrodivanillate O-demethylase
MENSFDPTHVEWLHGRLYNYHLKREGKEPTVLGGHHVKIAFDLVEYGIIKRRLREGQSEDSEDWRVGHPVVFPNILKVGGLGLSSFQIRVPVDDTNTLHFWYDWFEVPERYADLVNEIRHLPDTYPVTLQAPDGSFLMDTIDSQDAMVWVTQGDRTTRDGEHLSSSDQGIAMYRTLLRAQLDANEKGEPVMNVLAQDDDREVFELPQEQKELGLDSGGSSNPLSSCVGSTPRSPTGTTPSPRHIESCHGPPVRGSGRPDVYGRASGHRWDLWAVRGMAARRDLPQPPLFMDRCRW